MEKRLYRNENDKVIAGVSSGVAAYMEVDVTIIRLLFVLSTIFLMGTGILVYLVIWIMVPVNNDPAARYAKFNDFFKNQQESSTYKQPGSFSQPENPAPQSAPNWSSSTFEQQPFNPSNQPDYRFIKKNNDTGRTIGGLFLLVIGMYFLLNEFDIIPHWFSLGKLWPLIFVAIGISFVAKSKRKDPWQEWENQQTPPASGPADRPADVKDADRSANEPNTTPL
jgi:phage shock protein C